MATSAAHSNGQWPFDVLEILDVHDGDTIKIRGDLGHDAHHVFWLRIAGINAPELHNAGGKEAREYLAGLLGWKIIDPRDLRFVVVTHRRIASNEDERSFVRWVGDACLDYFEDPNTGAECRSVAHEMVAAGHADYVTAGLERW